MAQMPAEGEAAAGGKKPAAEQSTGLASADQSNSQVTIAGTPKPAEVPAVTAPALEHADGAVIIRRHDTLWHISRRVYGRGTRYSTIYLANQDQIKDPDMIWPGQVFKVPATSKEGEAANLKAMGDQMATNPAKTQ
jgi:nucleoid-associated protein YgaU